jgi:hypothetical protein
MTTQAERAAVRKFLDEQLSALRTKITFLEGQAFALNALLERGEHRKDGHD